ncbi:macrolide family glycosyltransferase [Actinoplanes sp. NPDC048796]|uniref:macrolide family glycosyltransferase n=1 Tax=unclassified Actinoplanes TaxID=2626549 RepID=UPI0033DD2E6B
MSRHIAVMNIPSHGHVIPTVSIVRELVARGHRVTYAAAGAFAGTFAAAGADVVRYESPYAEHGMHLDYGASQVVDVVMRSFDESEAIAAALRPVLDDDPPDLLAYDLTVMAAGRVTSRRWGVPAVQMSPLFASNAHTQLTRNVFARTAGSERLFQPQSTAGVDFFTRLTDSVRALGGDGVISPAEVLGAVEPLNLVFLPKEFQLAGDTFDDRYAFVGPCQEHDPAAATWQPPASGAPVVLISLGTTIQAGPEFFRTCVDAFAGSGLHLVMTIGDRFAPEELGPVPPGVELHPWVPHLDVLAHARALVCQGGMSSVMQSLAMGVPMVLVPQWGENRVNAERVVELGLGSLIAPEEVTAERLVAAVTELTSSPGYASAAARLRQDIRRAGGAERAADEIERLCAKG